jgi:hypothetical protein
MSAPVLHLFVALTDEADYLRLGWMRERPDSVVFVHGVWLIWPCGCPPVEPARGALCGGWWHRCVPPRAQRTGGATPLPSDGRDAKGKSRWAEK